MDRFSFFRLLGEAVYRIDGAYAVCSKNAGIKSNMLWLLSALNDGQKHSQSQICWDWNYPRTTVNTLVKELEKCGYVVLNPVPGTRRELYVELTTEGKVYADQILSSVYDAEEQLFNRYFRDHDVDFVHQLNAFSNAMKQFFMTGDYDDPESEQIDLKGGNNMMYSDFKGKKLSALGMGMMRLPVIDGNDACIDEAQVSEMFAYAIEHGVNYFDTAWGYHGGNSEKVVKSVLGCYPRDQYSLASKFPGYDLSTLGRKEEIFEAQLEKCGTDYFDFYLFHNVCEMNIDAYLDENIGLFNYLMEQKKNGRIRHLGFSAHGNLETMKRFLNAYGKYMEFCQIQLNWLDWSFQSAKEKVDLLNEWNIPIWVMEPVRGGNLTKLSEANVARLNALHPDWTLAEWAFRFLQGVKGVTVTLSGMTSLQQVKENIATYTSPKMLSENDMATLQSIADEMTARSTVPCTACRYCTTHCPQELNIPWLLSLYNEHSYSGGGFIAPMALSSLPDDKKPSACVGCRSCEQVCPQNIKISEALAAFDNMLK